MREQQVGHSRISIWATQRYRTQALPYGILSDAQAADADNGAAYAATDQSNMDVGPDALAAKLAHLVDSVTQVEDLSRRAREAAVDDLARYESLAASRISMVADWSRPARSASRYARRAITRLARQRKPRLRSWSPRPSRLSLPLPSSCGLAGHRRVASWPRIPMSICLSPSGKRWKPKPSGRKNRGSGATTRRAPG